MNRTAMYSAALFRFFLLNPDQLADAMDGWRQVRLAGLRLAWARHKAWAHERGHRGPRAMATLKTMFRNAVRVPGTVRVFAWVGREAHRRFGDDLQRRPIATAAAWSFATLSDEEKASLYSYVTQRQREQVKIDAQAAIVLRRIVGRRPCNAH
jgi:hypothetical protein